MLTSLKKKIVVGLLALSASGAVALIGYEGVSLPAYTDPVGVVTVCAGHTTTAKLGQVKTMAECEALLKQDVKHAEAAVKRLVKAPLTQNQFDALVSFVFNVGEGNFADSTLLRKINANDCLGAGAQFDRWVYGKGKKLPGLVVRRASERKHWETGCSKGNYKT